MKYFWKSSESFGRLRSNSETIAAKIKPIFCLEMGSKMVAVKMAAILDDVLNSVAS